MEDIVIFRGIIFLQIADEAHQFRHSQVPTGQKFAKVFLIKDYTRNIRQTHFQAIHFFFRERKIRIGVAVQNGSENRLNHTSFEMCLDFFLNLAIFLDDIHQSIDLAAGCLGDGFEIFFDVF
jgi:hypothetical protein